VCYSSSVIQLFLLLAALQSADQDVIHLKDGTTRSGGISREQVEAYVVEVLAGKDPVESFERMMGRNCARVDEEIKAHLESLK
jgi:hypothetical protein